MPTAKITALMSTLGLAVVIGILTLIPAPLPITVPGTDKLHHLLAFAALVFPIAALVPSWLVPATVLAACYGGLIEVVQPFVGRYGDRVDWIADLAGIAIGAGAGLLVYSGLAAARRRMKQH
jgi:VanZ family protein